MTYTARSGQFAQVVTPNYDFEVIYYPNALVLRASNALPAVTVFAPATQLVCQPFFVSATDDRGGVRQISTNIVLVTAPLHTLSLGAFYTTNAPRTDVFKICMLGETGSNYMVEAAEELSLPVVTNWHDIGVMTFTNGIWRYFDTDAMNFNKRYYRARQLP